jgi:hypothetical protein
MGDFVRGGFGMSYLRPSSESPYLRFNRFGILFHRQKL